jgi:hypothetical protein
MEAHSLLQHDFWEEVTDQFCATIAKEHVIYDSDCLGRTFAEAEWEGQPLRKEPYLAQAAKDMDHVKLARLGSTSDCHAKVTDFTEESSEDMTVDLPAQTDLNLLNLVSSSAQVSEGRRRIANDPQPPRFTPTRLPIMTQSSSRTITPGKLTTAPKRMAREYLNGSPTPAVSTTIKGCEPASSPTTPTTKTDIKSPKRKLSFGMPVFGGDDEVRMPPPKLRKTSPAGEDQLFSHFINADAVAKTSVEITFRDIRDTSQAYTRSNNEVPKTPMLVEFGLPSSPVVIRDDAESYPVCTDGFFRAISVHNLKSLRKTVDPTFQDDHYWGDSLYFSEEPVPSLYAETDTSRLHSLDWRIIFHALDNDAERRVPLPDITTMPRMSNDHLNEILLKFTGDDKEKAITQATMPRDWTKAQISEAGMKWTELRGTYYRDPPEFTTRSSQDVCADHEFRLFCNLAQFVEGRPAVLSKGTLACLKYARLANMRRRPQTAAFLRQRTELVPNHSNLASPAPLPNETIDENDLAYPLGSSALGRPQDSMPALSQHAQTMSQVPTVIQHNTSLVSRAFQDINVFITEVPRANLLEMQRQYLQARAQHYMQQNWAILTNPPTPGQLWTFFRQRTHANSVARWQQAEKEAAASAEAQASMLRNSFVGQPDTPISTRSVQLQYHVPTTPGSRGGLTGNGTGDMAINPLGSPFRTPARMRSDSIDPRLLHS